MELSRTILLIDPPTKSCLLPCWEAAVVAGSLSGSGLEPAYYDANLDFYRTDLIFEEEKFYDPHYFLSLKRKIKQVQTQASPVGLPSFSLFCEQGLGKEMTRHDPGTAIFFVSSPDQVLAAQTMAGFIKSRYPKVPVVAMARTSPDILDVGCFDRLIPNAGPQGIEVLIDFLNTVHGTAIDPQTIIPDFKGMSLDQYLTPEKILLVYPFFLKILFFCRIFWRIRSVRWGSRDLYLPGILCIRVNQPV